MPDPITWIFGGVSLIGTFYAARVIYRRNQVGAVYLFGLLLLLAGTTLTGIAAQDTRLPFCFLTNLVLAVLFAMLVGWRVRETRRIIRGRLAILVWLAGGVGLHLSALVDRLHWHYPLGRFVALPPWAYGGSIGMVMLGLILATLQLRDAEWYFN